MSDSLRHRSSWTPPVRAVLAVLLVAFHVDEGGPQEQESTPAPGQGRGGADDDDLPTVTAGAAGTSPTCPHVGPGDIPEDLRWHGSWPGAAPELPVLASR